MSNSPRVSDPADAILDMTLLYASPRFLEHDTGGRHPERPERLRSIHRHLERTGLAASCQRPEWSEATERQIARIHEPQYVERLRQFIAEGGRRLEVDTNVSRESLDVARLAAGAAVDAVARVVRGEDRNAMALVRPPGHHALRGGAMGFCLLNNVAIAAAAALEEHALDRVLIVDWDVHHGNGTQDAFWNSEHVGFLSIHRWPFYPGSGSAEETGEGPGLGATLNVPVEMGTPRRTYRERFRAALEDFADRMRPQLVLVSAGFDSHREDPVGSLGLETEDFGLLTRDVIEIAESHAQGKLVCLLEGGYNVGVLPACVEETLRALLEASGATPPGKAKWPPDEPPEA